MKTFLVILAFVASIYFILSPIYRKISVLEGTTLKLLDNAIDAEKDRLSIQIKRIDLEHDFKAFVYSAGYRKMNIPWLQRCVKCVIRDRPLSECERPEPRYYTKYERKGG